MSSASRKPKSGLPTPKAIFNYFSVNGGNFSATPTLALDKYAACNVAQVLSGVVAANTLKTFINVAGSGTLKYLRVQAQSGNARNIRAKLTLDGVVVFDVTAGMTVLYTGMEIVGAATTAVGGVYAELSFDAIPFSSSMLFEVSMDATSPNEFAVLYNYATN